MQSAIAREKTIKEWKRAWKIELIEKINPPWQDLYEGHSFDNASLVETLEMQKETVLNARELAGSLPVAISPVTLKPRFNPYVTAPPPAPNPGELPPQVDVRQMSLFGACWTLGSLKYLSESGARSITYYETTGWRGVMERAAGSPLPEEFNSLPGAVFPLYHVLADVGEFAGGVILPSRSSEPLEVECMAISNCGRRRILVGNMTGNPLQVCVGDLPSQVQVKSLDETEVWNAMANPEDYRRQESMLESAPQGALLLELRPYSVTRIDATCE